MKDRFDTRSLPARPDAVAPDGSHVRLLGRVGRGSAAHFELTPGTTSVAVAHRSVDEIWYFLTGRGEMWRKNAEQEAIVPVGPGVCITIPAGTAFQFRAELEEAIIAARGAGGMVRTMDEWSKHPQAAAIASLPLMEIVKIDTSRPEPLPIGDRPLSGVRVRDLTRVLAGPICARTLAEHGADVLTITAAQSVYEPGHVFAKLLSSLETNCSGEISAD